MVVKLDHSYSSLFLTHYTTLITRMLPSRPTVKMIPNATGTRKFVRLEMIVSLREADTLTLVRRFLAMGNNKS